MSKQALSDLERIKTESAGLYHPIAAELATDTPFSDDAVQLLKHHGIYRQRNRDVSTTDSAASSEPEWRFMVRGKIPGGRLAAYQYLACDDLAKTYGHDELRITSREGLQFYGVTKAGLKPLVRALNEKAGLSTLGASGDVGRNVTAPPVADIDPRYQFAGGDLVSIAQEISRHFLPRTSHYGALWLGETPKTVTEEPLYGRAYLPRKLKIAIATTFDNAVDVFTNDIGLIAVTDGKDLTGYEVLVGGGLGHTPNNQKTFPRLATPLTFVSHDQLLKVLEAVALVLRDYGDRANRNHARLKYLVEEWGIEVFRQRVEDYLGAPLPHPRRSVVTGQNHYLGWHKQRQADQYYLGLSIPGGRICDVADGPRYKTGLRAVVHRFQPEVRLTPQHNLVLANIKDVDRPEVERMLSDHGIAVQVCPDSLRHQVMACVALPYCPRAMGEAERLALSLLSDIEQRVGSSPDVVMRISGCPNGCSRPRMAELGIVASGRNRYALFAAGSRTGTRLNQLVVNHVDVGDLAPTVAALITQWQQDANPEELFGDWSFRVGVDALNKALR